MSVAEIKAIETRYAGCRFRSRLEARWAVFFDAYGVRWLYEPQGYDIGGPWYLPDFWLPDLAMWVEVKGRFGHGEWESLCQALSHLPAKPNNLPVGHAGHAAFRRTPVLMLLGQIPDAEIAPLAHQTIMRWDLDAGREPLVVLSLGRFVSPRYLMPCYDSWAAESEADPNKLLDGLDCSYAFAPNMDLALAYERARRARFEHGERG